MTNALDTPAGEQDLLRRRSQALAKPPVAVADGGTLLRCIVFRLAAEEYAIDASLVNEVALLKDLTPLPGTPSWIMGIMSLRGRIVAVMDLKEFLGLPAGTLSDLNKVILLNSDTMDLGLLADEILGIRNVAAEAIQDTPPATGAARAEYVRGVTAERLVVLDVAQILSDRRIVVHEEVV